MADTYTVERTTTIAAPPERIFPALVDFHEWVHWSPWEGLDPEMERTYGGSEQGSGATYARKGNRKAGVGSMRIVSTEAPNGLVIDLEFLKPFKAHNAIHFQLEPAGEGTSVTWTMQGTKTFMTKVMGIFTSMDKLVGKDFEKGL